MCPAAADVRHERGREAGALRDVPVRPRGGGEGHKAQKMPGGRSLWLSSTPRCLPAKEKGQGGTVRTHLASLTVFFKEESPESAFWKGNVKRQVPSAPPSHTWLRSRPSEPPPCPCPTVAWGRIQPKTDPGKKRREGKKKVILAKLGSHLIAEIGRAGSGGSAPTGSTSATAVVHGPERCFGKPGSQFSTHPLLFRLLPVQENFLLKFQVKYIFTYII